MTKGTIIIGCGKMLVRHGYTIKVLNTINFTKSMHYNPFHYIRSEKDILKLVSMDEDSSDDNDQVQPAEHVCRCQ